MRRAYGPARCPGPGDLGVRDAADKEDRQDEEAEACAMEDLAADDYMLGGWQDED